MSVTQSWRNCFFFLIFLSKSFEQHFCVCEGKSHHVVVSLFFKTGETAIQCQRAYVSGCAHLVYKQRWCPSPADMSWRPGSPPGPSHQFLPPKSQTVEISDKLTSDFTAALCVCMKVPFLLHSSVHLSCVAQLQYLPWWHRGGISHHRQWAGSSEQQSGFQICRRALPSSHWPDPVIEMCRFLLKPNSCATQHSKEHSICVLLDYFGVCVVLLLDC